MRLNFAKLMMSTCLLIVQLMSVSTASARSGGAIAGGGGESLELRVDDIRKDILSWINDGGAKGLSFPSDLTLFEYELKMKDYLRPQYVIVSFVENDDSLDDESQVSVEGALKTCRGFISNKDSRAHILCNTQRFMRTIESEQYKLIHHEYAGLAGVEKNDGASSDYVLSSQLTDFLKKQSVLKLTIKKQDLSSEYMPDKLFGKIYAYRYPPKFACYSAYQFVCNLPSMEEIDYIIESYKRDHSNRLNKLENYGKQYDNDKRILLDMAIGLETEFGENKLSAFFRKIKNILESKLNFQALEKWIGLESPFLEKLQKIKSSVERESSEDYYFLTVYDKKDEEGSELFENFNKVIETISKRRDDYNIDFLDELVIEKKCVEQLAKWDIGTYYFKKYLSSVFSIREKENKEGQLGFHIGRDLALLKETFIGIDHQPIRISCMNVGKDKDASKLLPMYNKLERILVIPYRAYKEFRQRSLLDFVIDQKFELYRVEGKGDNEFMLSLRKQLMVN